MQPRRFSFDPANDILEHATKIELTIHKINGNLAVEFTLSGEAWPADGDESDGTLAQQAKDPAELARELLRLFITTKRSQ